MAPYTFNVIEIAKRLGVSPASREVLDFIDAWIGAVHGNRFGEYRFNAWGAVTGFIPYETES